ncbi:MAG: hypothetical protein G01um101416_887 [Microgenomates group bacterium Gr01-1014_16]|nr:MAG: hypothetical protein G01um101416_887 [Microgenomates group bacterium Gr01-1014_16]
MEIPTAPFNHVYPKLKAPLATIIWLLIVSIILVILLLLLFKFYKTVTATSAQPDNKSANPTPMFGQDHNQSPEDRVPTLGTSDCVSPDWNTFDQENWSGMSWFSIANNVWTLSSPELEKDAAIYYKDHCTDGSLAEYQIIPRLENYLNINVYIRGLLRWEVGGRDRRSIRLYKNVAGCGTGEIKKSILIELPNEYLPNHDEIPINQPLIIHSAIFYLENGKIRSEVWLTYSSPKRGGEIVTTPRETYYYDFEVGSKCSLTYMPDINKESYQHGIGLQQISNNSSDNPPPLPKFSPENYRLRQFGNSD